MAWLVINYFERKYIRFSWSLSISKTGAIINLLIVFRESTRRKCKKEIVKDKKFKRPKFVFSDLIKLNCHLLNLNFIGEFSEMQIVPLLMVIWMNTHLKLRREFLYTVNHNTKFINYLTFGFKFWVAENPF